MRVSLLLIMLLNYMVKQQDEDVGIKEHGAVPFSVFCLEIYEGRRLTAAALWLSSLRSRALPRESGPRG